MLTADKPRIECVDAGVDRKMIKPGLAQHMRHGTLCKGCAYAL